MVRFIIGQRVIVAKKGEYHGLVGTIVKKKARKYLVDFDGKKCADYFKPTEIFEFKSTKKNNRVIHMIDCGTMDKAAIKECTDKIKKQIKEKANRPIYTTVGPEAKPDEVQRVLDTLDIMRNKRVMYTDIGPEASPEQCRKMKRLIEYQNNAIIFAPKFKIGDKVLVIDSGKYITDRIRSIIFKRIGNKDFIAYNLNSYTGDYLEGLLRKDEPLLDKQERRFLRNLLIPVKAISVIKCRSEGDSLEYLAYRTQNEFDNDVNELRLPAFPAGYMYKNLELNKEYSLEELGIR